MRNIIKYNQKRYRHKLRSKQLRNKIVDKLKQDILRCITNPALYKEQKVLFETRVFYKKGWCWIKTGINGKFGKPYRLCKSRKPIDVINLGGMNE